ncbi:helix-turn-helix transcriptional regulator [Allonocardiopsis opalescens]|uniref:helix-turn-helix transcriptional regulator n=1 Tax=Allonocardiopsis opalescens TaxID=1144618 RepID=UPI000D071CDE|nr:helix-turn-helix domain-containing protein [Allonocardiopsis opalescens]
MGTKGDALLSMPEICDLVRRPEGTVRDWILKGGEDAPPIWKLRGRRVAWKSELIAWLNAQRAASLSD